MSIIVWKSVEGKFPTVAQNSHAGPCRSGEWERALEVFRRMESVGSEPTSEVCPNSISYNTAISACGKAGRWHEAMFLKEKMQHADLPMDVVTLSSLVTACEKVGRWEEALSLFNEAKENGVKPNVFCFNSLISALGHGGQWTAAIEAFDEMVESGLSPDVVTYSGLISACQRGYQLDIALDFYKRMKDNNVLPNAYTFMSLFKACEAAGSWEIALELFSEMQAMDIEFDSVTMAAKTLMYTWPQLITRLPAPVVAAAKAAVSSGQAARRWIDRKP